MAVPSRGKASRQGGVTLSSSEAEFVAASQAGQEVLYLRALLKGFAYLQHGPTKIWEDSASCILMSENPTNRERSRHVDVSYETWCADKPAVPAYVTKRGSLSFFKAPPMCIGG